MELFLWIVGIVVAIVVWAIWVGGRKEKAYRQIIATLMHELTTDPAKFFYPDYELQPSNRIGDLQLTELLLRKIMLRALERGVRSPMNANLIPSDIKDLPDVNYDFQRLHMLALSIANDRY